MANDLSLPAAALVRTFITGDPDRGVAILTAHGGADSAELSTLAVSVAGIAARAVLSANGYNVHKALEIIDGWIDEASRSAA